jgi:hypothetical protein
MTGHARSPRLVKAGIMPIDPETGSIAGSIALQHDSETLTGSFDTPPLQAKLKIGPSGDEYEREADAVADLEMETFTREAVVLSPTKAARR